MRKTILQRINIFINSMIVLLAAVSLIWAFVLRQPESTSSQAAPVAATPIVTESPMPLKKESVTIEKPPEEKSVTDDHSTLILELFNPSDQSLTHHVTETSITQQIEQIQTSSFVLRKCDLIGDAEYADSFRALIAYAVQMDLAPDIVAAEKKVRQIAESAGTSYSLVYSRTKCDSPQLPEIARQLLIWQEGYLK